MDVRDKFTCHAFSAKQNSAGGIPPGGLVTCMKSTLFMLLVESCDYILAVKVNNVFAYNDYLLTDYHSDTSDTSLLLPLKSYAETFQELFIVILHD